MAGHCDVILPLALPKAYTYEVPADLREELKIGARVVVQFGTSKRYSALVFAIHDSPPEHYKAKPIEAILDKDPIVSEKQLRFWQWMATYYLCGLGEVMGTALPARLKMSSVTRVFATEVGGEGELKEQEQQVVMLASQKNGVSIKEVAQALSRKSVHVLVKSMTERRWLRLEEPLQKGYQRKTEAYVHLTAAYDDDERLAVLCDELVRAPKQLAILMMYVQMTSPSERTEGVARKRLLKRSNAPLASLYALVDKGVFELEEREVDRVSGRRASKKLEDLMLSKAQASAYEQLIDAHQRHQPVLLHGITSSGKTEVYIKRIMDVVAEGKQVLFLVPEIALTTQLIDRLSNRFPGQVAVYHSRLTDNERVEIWQFANRGAAEDPLIFLGARSAIFLPFQNLGLVIVDEEHDGSFKQQHPAPRYHARDAAVVLAQQQQAGVVLGTATPSMESFANAQQGKYTLVELNERYGGVQLPAIGCVDLKTAYRKKQMTAQFSPQLLHAMGEVLGRGDQVILFQNRRGYAPFLQCDSCGWVPTCEQCDISLTYHRVQGKLRCHYCGYHLPYKNDCLACGSPGMNIKGFGTEKVEDELSGLFPQYRIARLDWDTTRSKYAYDHILSAFADGETQILVGTQMVTKGLDFDNVGLVGVLQADALLNHPDFRAGERAFQLMEQVAGRAGRKEKVGKVILQTFQPKHPVIRDVLNHDFHHHYQRESQLREKFLYPPYCRLVQITARHKDAEQVREGAQALASLLKPTFGERLLGPEFPLTPRLRNQYHMQLLIKLSGGSLQASKQFIQEQVRRLEGHPSFRNIRYVLDVDPM